MFDNIIGMNTIFFLALLNIHLTSNVILVLPLHVHVLKKYFTFQDQLFSFLSKSLIHKLEGMSKNQNYPTIAKLVIKGKVIAKT
jgi:hypothetical protein